MIWLLYAIWFLGVCVPAVAMHMVMNAVGHWSVESRQGLTIALLIPSGVWVWAWTIFISWIDRIATSRNQGG